MKKIYLLLFFLGLLTINQTVYSVVMPSGLWPIQSIDTMKVSRDMARSELNDRSFDMEIIKELQEIKNLGANYVAIDTPYDDEFLPYLTRWVDLARKTGLHIWFRGNWSNWEGWFDYPKNMTPEEHQIKTAKFIETHSYLFQDGDIFDPCPECENSGYWKQPDYNAAYNKFIQSQRIILKNSFNKINKNVFTNIFSIIGGRAKEVLTQNTLNDLDNVVTIDHYVKDPSLMSEYINYFSQKQTKVLLGEFGAPIPDINGPMDESQQAKFVKDIFEVLFKSGDKVEGINYNVLTLGSSELFNDDGTQRQVGEVIKDFFIPGVVKGTVTNTLGDRLNNIAIRTTDESVITSSDSNGNFLLKIPANSAIDILIGGNGYKTVLRSETLGRGDEIKQNIILEPGKMGFIYKIRLEIQNVKNKFFSWR